MKSYLYEGENMNDLGEIERAARRAVAAFREWMDADGVFPEPEYDLFLGAMNRLDDALRGDESEKIPHTP